MQKTLMFFFLVTLLFNSVSAYSTQPPAFPIHRLYLGKSVVGIVVGSMHSGYESSVDIESNFNLLIRSSKSVYFEMDVFNSNVRNKLAEELSKANSNFFKTHLHQKTRRSIEHLVRSRHEDTALVDEIQKQHPFVQSQLISGKCITAHKTNAISIDMLMHKIATNKKLRFKSLEQADEFAALINSVSTDEWIEALNQTANFSSNPICGAKLNEHMHKISLYIERCDYENALVESVRFSREDSFGITLLNKIVYPETRNKRLAQRIYAVLSAQEIPIFVLGAGHLAGTSNVLNELASKGVNIDRCVTSYTN